MNQLILILLAIALIAMVCYPLLKNTFQQKSKGNTLKNRLKAETHSQHLGASDFKTWRDAYCIGLDKSNSQLLYLNLHENGSAVQTVDLQKIRICKPLKTYREGKEKRQIINKVSLVLSHFDDQKRPLEIELFDENRSDYMINEWELAQTWAQKINELKN